MVTLVGYFFSQLVEEGVVDGSVADWNAEIGGKRRAQELIPSKYAQDRQLRW